jgi:hypothetical protein
LLLAALFSLLPLWLQAGARAQDSHRSGPEANPAGDAATPENPTAAREAREHFRAGIEHYQARRFREAIREFELAAALVPSADLWFNIARSHEQLGEWSQAADFYRRYLRDRVDPPDRAQVEALIAALGERAEAERAARRTRPTTGTLRVESSVAGAQVRVGGRPVGRAPLPVPLSLTPGTHRLEVRSDGYVPFRADVAIVAGVTTGAYADLEPITEHRAIRGTRLWTWVVGGLGVAAFLGAGMVGALALAQDTDEDRRRWATASDVALGAGLALAVGATLLWFVEGRAIGTETLRGGHVVASR